MSLLDDTIQRCGGTSPDNTRKIKVAILKEYEAMRTGDMYIENAADASRFLSHLVFLVTNGQEGEERKFLSEEES